MPSKVILIVIEFMFLGINMFWARPRLILARAGRLYFNDVLCKNMPEGALMVASAEHLIKRF